MTEVSTVVVRSPALKPITERVKHFSVKRTPTSGVEMCVSGSEVGTEDARVTVLGFRRVNIQAAHLAICAIHHLHKLTTPWGQSKLVLLPWRRLRQEAILWSEILWQHNSICYGIFKIMLTNFNTNKRLGLCSNRPG